MRSTHVADEIAGRLAALAAIVVAGLAASSFLVSSWAAAYSYDVEQVAALTREASSVPDVEPSAPATSSAAQAYDDVTQPPRASARLVGYRSAPRATRGGAGSVDEALSGLAAGRSSGVRVVGSADELDDLFAGLSRSGSQINSSYPGKLVRLDDGTTGGLRGASRSGGPTIDVRLPDGRTVKVHVDPWPPAG